MMERGFMKRTEKTDQDCQHCEPSG